MAICRTVLRVTSANLAELLCPTRSTYWFCKRLVRQLTFRRRQVVKHRWLSGGEYSQAPSGRRFSRRSMLTEPTHLSTAVPETRGGRRSQHTAGYGNRCTKAINFNAGTSSNDCPWSAQAHPPVPIIYCNCIVYRVYS